MEDTVSPELDALLAQYVREFEESEDATREAREKAERDRDYYDEKQWTSEEKAALEARGQPATVMNEIKPKVNTMMGLEKQTRKDPKAFPVNPDDEQAARAATDAVRYVCEDSRWDDKRSQAAKELAIEGTCAVMVGVKKVRRSSLMNSTAMTAPQADPEIRRIAWDRFYYDPHSSEFDFSDAGFMGVVVWMDLDAAVAKYPNAKEILQATWAGHESSETYDDKPKYKLWADHKRRRVRICEHYCLKDGVWTFSMFTKGGFVSPPRPSPYLGDDGEPENPIKAVSLYIDRDNNRYGEVRSMIGAQDETNKRRSKGLHLITERQVRVSPNVAQDARDVRKELSRPDGVFIGESGDVEILPTNDMARGNFEMMLDARSFIHRTGPNQALAGKTDQDLSGRAIVAQQQGGMVENASFLDCVRVLSLAVYRSVWCRIRQCWPAERWIRVTDDENNVRFVGLNRQITALQAMAEKLGVTKENAAQIEQQKPEIAEQLRAFAADPRSQQMVIENNVAELDVDIMMDEGIDTPTVAAEQFDTLAKMLPGAPPHLQPVLWEELLSASALRNKGRIVEKLQQPPSPEQQQMQEIQMAGAVAEVEKTQSETARNIAQAQAADPSAQMQLETAKAEHKAGLDEQKQQHGMAMAERKQVFGEQMAQQAANRPQKDAA